MHSVKRTQGIGNKQLCSPKKSIKIGPWSNGKGSRGLMSPDIPRPRIMGSSGREERQMKRCTYRALCVPCEPVGAVLPSVVDSVGQVQVMQCYMCTKNEVSWIHWMTRFFTSLDFFLPWWHFKMTVPRFILLKFWKRIGYYRVQP